MAQLTASGIMGAIYGLFSGLDATDETLLKNLLYRRTVKGTVTDGGTAGTAQTETPLWKNTTGASVRVVGITVTAPIAVTGHATTNAVFTVTKRDSAGGTAAVVGTYTTTLAAPANSLTAFLPATITLTAANVVVASNEVLTILMSKGSTGVAVGAAVSVRADGKRLALLRVGVDEQNGG